MFNKADVSLLRGGCILDASVWELKLRCNPGKKGGDAVIVSCQYGSFPACCLNGIVPTHSHMFTRDPDKLVLDPNDRRRKCPLLKVEVKRAAGSH